MLARIIALKSEADGGDERRRRHRVGRSRYANSRGGRGRRGRWGLSRLRLRWVRGGVAVTVETSAVAFRFLRLMLLPPYEFRQGLRGDRLQNGVSVGSRKHHE